MNMMKNLLYYSSDRGDQTPLAQLERRYGPCLERLLYPAPVLAYLGTVLASNADAADIAMEALDFEIPEDLIETFSELSDDGLCAVAQVLLNLVQRSR